MLLVTVTLLPLGDGQSSRVLGTMKIVNDGAGDMVRGNYQVRLNSGTNAALAVGAVKGYYRAKGAWPLVALALQSALDAAAVQPYIPDAPIRRVAGVAGRCGRKTTAGNRRTRGRG